MLGGRLFRAQDGGIGWYEKGVRRLGVTSGRNPCLHDREAGVINARACRKDNR